MRSITIPIFFLIVTHILGQEVIKNTNSLPHISNRIENPKEVTHHIIEAIEKIRNIKYVTENKSTIPYQPTVFNEPYIMETVASMDSTDVHAGSVYKNYILEDTFNLYMLYDGKYILDIDNNNKINITDFRKNPRSLMGPIHLRIKTMLENALKRNAEIEVVSSNDSVRIEITFKNLQIEFSPTGILIAKDTTGFVSRYTIYIDRFTYLPTKTVRKMSYNTSIETILYQEVNFTDTLSINVLQSTNENYSKSMQSDNSNQNRFINSSVKKWRLKEVEGDSVLFSEMKEKKFIMVFNSIGWKPCMQAVSFLKQLRIEYSNDILEIVCVEPYITNIDVLKSFKQKHEINYPIVVANPIMKKDYSIIQVPVFIMINQDGIIRNIITGFKEKNTALEIRKIIQDL